MGIADIMHIAMLAKDRDLVIGVVTTGTNGDDFEGMVLDVNITTLVLQTGPHSRKHLNTSRIDTITFGI